MNPNSGPTGLVAAGAPGRFAGLDPSIDDATARWAVGHCHLMRNRFTVVDLLDLLDLLGRWTEDDRDAVLAAAEDAVAVAVAVAEKATCLGSGMLAAAAVGLHPSIRAAATAMSDTGAVYLPHDGRAPRTTGCTALPAALSPAQGRPRRTERGDTVTTVTPTDSPALLRRPGRLYDGYVFDLDGTVYLGDALLPGAADVIARVRALGRRTVFLSNNPTRDPQMYADKLDGLGIPTPLDDIVNPVVTVPRWLQAHHPGAGVFAISEEPLKRALTAAGIRLTEDPEEIDVVLASFDRTFEYRKLQIAFDALWFHKRARLITSNPDRFCPMPGGRGEPDAASIVAAIEACTGVMCEANLGKPGAEMLETVLGMLGLSADRCVMVGDRLSTDIAMAATAGMDSALVLTGETTPEMAGRLPQDGAPTWILDRIDHLLPAPEDDVDG